VFFGEFQSFGFLLPILISCLNYNDPELKRAFFRNIGGICDVTGGKCVRMILPCIMPEIYGMREWRQGREKVREGGRIREGEDGGRTFSHRMYPVELGEGDVGGGGTDFRKK
jgi:hypothetical protein